jgi:hypothetical protein
VRLGAILYIIIPCHLFVAYIVELAAAQQARAQLRGNKKRSGTATPGGSYVPSEQERLKFQSTWKLIAWIHGFNATLCLLITSVVVYFFIHHPLIGTLSEVHAVIVWLKTASYAFTNRDLRHAYLHPSKREEDALPDIYNQCPYPENITLGNLTYFWWAPTLVVSIFLESLFPVSGCILSCGILKKAHETCHTPISPRSSNTNSEIFYSTNLSTLGQPRLDGYSLPSVWLKSLV